MPFRSQIDWNRPWLAPLRATGEPISQETAWRAALNAQAAVRDLRNAKGKKIRFVGQSELPPDTAYETYISDTGRIPTRENLHDFFNALVWLTYPRIKAQLNALQAGEIVRQTTAGASVVRGAVRDAVTIFDENAAILLCRDTGLIAALRAHAWQDLFIARRDSFHQSCNIFLFGHALMEKLVAPYKAITAHVWVIPAQVMEGISDDAQMDSMVADELASGATTSDFLPLPILGVPGWWPGQDSAFYLDNQVFRPPKQNPAN